MAMYVHGVTAKGATDVARGQVLFHASCFILTYSPALLQSYFNMGHLLGVGKEFVKAEEAYQTAMQLNPVNPSAYSNMGKLLADQEKFEVYFFLDSSCTLVSLRFFSF